MRLRDRVEVFHRAGRNRELRRVGLAFAGFQVAEFAVWIAILVFAYDRGGAAAASLVAVVQTVPAGVFAPIGGALADRHQPGRVLACGYAAQTAALAAVAAALLADAPAPLVYGLSALPATAFAITRPAQAALLPALSRTPDELTAANVAAGWIETVMSLVGPLLSGAMLTVASPGAVYALFAAVVGLSTLFAITLHTDVPLVARGVRPGIFAEVAAGFHTLATSPRPRLLVALLAAGYVAWGALDVLMVVLAVDELGLGEGGTGYVYAAFGLGGLLGAVAAAGLVGRRRLTPAIVVASVVWGVAFALLGASGQVAVALALLGIAGAGSVLFDVSGRTLLQRISPPDVIARFFGIHESLTMLMFAVGALLVPPLLDAGASLAFVVTGAILPAVVLLVVVRLLAIDRGALVPIVEISLLRSMPIFEHLPPPELEGVAHWLERREVAAGVVIIRQGDLGDVYYAIAEGEVEVEVDGCRVTRYGRGQGFGEIALLRDAPRNATVIALTSCSLFTLEREAFLTAVNGHVHAVTAAEAIVQDRGGEHAAAGGSPGGGHPLSDR